MNKLQQRRFIPNLLYYC